MLDCFVVGLLAKTITFGCHIGLLAMTEFRLDVL
jgi:hypothetical protein